MTETSRERRTAQRVNANLKLEVTLPDGDGGDRTASLETINISTSGIYFRSDHFIEPMTKLAMEIEVDVPGDAPGAFRTAIVACEGLVVRVTPEAEVEGCDAYEAAVFFTGVSPEGMTNLERHIALLIDAAS